MSSPRVITPNDTDPDNGGYDHIRVGTGGNLSFVTRDGASESPVEVITIPVPAYETLWNLDVKYVRSTGTTAGDIIGFND